MQAPCNPRDGTSNVEREIMSYPSTEELKAIMARQKAYIIDNLKYDCLQGAGLQALAVSELFFAVESAPKGILHDATLDGCVRNIVKGLYLLLDSKDPDSANDVLGAVQELLIACGFADDMDKIIKRIEIEGSDLTDLKKTWEEFNRENE
jgi:hypothetical protein